MMVDSAGAISIWKNNPRLRKAVAERMQKRWKNKKYRLKMTAIATKFPHKDFPKEVYLFIAMQKRVKAGVTTTVWPRTVDGFYKFLKDVGRIPSDMVWPSLGRKNHNNGYTKKNCGWQEMRDNGIEAVMRSWENRRSDPALVKEYSNNLSRAQTGRKFTKEHRKNISIAARNRKVKP